MNSNFPAAVCAMIVNKMQDSNEHAPVEQLRDARVSGVGLGATPGQIQSPDALDAAIEDPLQMDLSMNDGASGIGGPASDLGSDLNSLGLTQPSENDFDVPEIRDPDSNSKSMLTTTRSSEQLLPTETDPTPQKPTDDGFTWRTQQLLTKITVPPVI